MFDLRKFCDDLENAKNDIDEAISDNKYMKKYLSNVEEFDGDFEDSRLDDFINNGGFKSKIDYLTNEDLYNFILGKCDILEYISCLEDIDDLREKDESDFEEYEIDDLNKLKENFDKINVKEFVSEINRFGKEATKYVTKHKLELEDQIDPSFYKR